MSTATESYAKTEVESGYSPTYRNRFFLMCATFHVNGVRAGVAHYSQRLVHSATKKYGKTPKVIPGTPDPRFAAKSDEEQVTVSTINSPNTKWGGYYFPSHEEQFHGIMSSLAIRPSDYVFIDLGAGKGLPLLLAAEYSFQSITGVEYSKALVETANQNIEAYRRQTGSDDRIQCIWGDATDFKFPDQPTILYLFNPFQGKVMDRVVANVEKSLRTAPRDLWVVYVNPWEGRKFRRSRMFETIEWNLEYSVHRSIRM